MIFISFTETQPFSLLAHKFRRAPTLHAELYDFCGSCMCVLSTHLSYGNRRLPLHSKCSKCLPCDDTVVQDRSFRGLPFISLSVSTLTTALQYTTYTNRHPSARPPCVISSHPDRQTPEAVQAHPHAQLTHANRPRSLRTRDPPSSPTCKSICGRGHRTPTNRPCAKAHPQN